MLHFRWFLVLKEAEVDMDHSSCHLWVLKMKFVLLLISCSGIFYFSCSIALFFSTLSPQYSDPKQKELKHEGIACLACSANLSPGLLSQQHFLSLKLRCLTGINPLQYCLPSKKQMEHIIFTKVITGVPTSLTEENRKSWRRRRLSSIDKQHILRSWEQQEGYKNR